MQCREGLCVRAITDNSTYSASCCRHSIHVTSAVTLLGVTLSGRLCAGSSSFATLCTAGEKIPIDSCPRTCLNLLPTKASSYIGTQRTMESLLLCMMSVLLYCTQLESSNTQHKLSSLSATLFRCIHVPFKHDKKSDFRFWYSSQRI